MTYNNARLVNISTNGDSNIVSSMHMQYCYRYRRYFYTEVMESTSRQFSTANHYCRYFSSGRFCCVVTLSPKDAILFILKR